ncbi:MAG: MerR family transcriptional regulator [Paracoccaceae bacterium]
MAKSPEAFRTISEVADWLGVQAHVLRFWESKFAQVKPVKRAGGRRYYRPADMLLLGGIKKLLHDDGMTIKGVQKLLREQGASYVADHSPSLDDLTMAQLDGEVAGVGDAFKNTVLPFESRQSAEAPKEEVPADEPTDDIAAEQPAAETTSDDVDDEKPSEPEQPSITFASHAAQSETPNVPEPEITDAALVEPAAEIAEVEDLQNSEPTPVTLEPAPAAPELPPQAEPESTPEPEIETAAQCEPEPEPEPNVVLPSFMHKRNTETAAPPPKVPRIVDAPDGPSEDQIEVPPGLLARLSALNHVPAGKVDDFRAARSQLEALYTRLSGTGKE